MKLSTYLSLSRHGIFYFRWPLPRTDIAHRPCVRVSLRTRCPVRAGTLARYLASCGEITRDNNELARLRQDKLHELVRNYFHAQLAEINPVVPVVLSCTSIPTMFSNFNGDRPTPVPFTNRALVDQIARNSNRERVIYGDWGSSRPRENGGFASRPLDRIDYPTNNAWYIARNKDEEWDFRDAAIAVINSDEWDGNLNIWGEEMIRNTTVNPGLGVDTPQKNVATRVNIHLHRQAFFGQPGLSTMNFDEAWED